MSDNPPTAKYRYTLQITGNTLSEIDGLLLLASNDFLTQASDRDEFTVESGRHTQVLAVVNPEQTPDRYAADLEAWMMRRREARR